MARYAVINKQTKIVENIIEVDPSNLPYMENKLLIDATSAIVKKGFFYDEKRGVFIPNEVTVPQKAVAKIRFINPLNNNPVTYIRIDPVTGKAQILIEIQILDPISQKLSAVSGEYLVPYRSAIDGRQKGSVIVSVVNGKGQKFLEFSKFQTGIYIVKAKDILDAISMKPVERVIFDPPEVKLAVVE